MCKIYASGIEAAFTRDPVLEPSFLYGGYPCKDLRHKFLMAQGSDVADCISSRETLEKYAVSFIYDVGAYLETLDKVEKMEAAMFIPAHAEAAVDVKELVRFNREKVYEIAERILKICEEPMCSERILQEVFKGYGLSMDMEQYVLVGSTVRSYLAWLKDAGKLSAGFTDSMLLWQKI